MSPKMVRSKVAHLNYGGHHHLGVDLASEECARVEALLLQCRPLAIFDSIVAELVHSVLQAKMGCFLHFVLEVEL
jgi:hypothetical protein